MTEKPAPADQPEPSDKAPAASDEPQQSDAAKAAEIADEKEKSGAETVV
jgi:hypothetical protein